jgi:pyruvate/2-oxoglutarate dehydrogenase complex dihydrolipoamide acyltransferase (E2) component
VGDSLLPKEGVMSKLMWIAGILLIAAGVALGAMLFVSTPTVGVWLSFESVVLLLVGGVLALGLGSVISGLQNLPVPVTEVREVPAAAAAPAAAIPEFGRRAAEAAPAAAAAAVSAASSASAREPLEVSEPTRETIKALEQARQKIEQAFEPKQQEEAPAEREEAPEAIAETSEPEPAPEDAAVEAEAVIEEEVVIEEDVMEEGQLYVVEERLIRMRPARILSDGTVEAETDEGWMRFENLEHLDEYLDAMAPEKA